MKQSISVLVSQLNSDHEKAILNLENTKKQIDDNFKIELKSLSKQYA